MDHQRSLAPSPFPDDDGTADPAVRQAIAGAHSGEPGDYLAAVAALCDARLLVPVTAVATATTEVSVPTAGGTTRPLTSDKESDMAVVMLRTADGTTAMLTFTGMDALQTWNPAARPVPVTLDLAARAAVDEGAGTLLVDLQGPTPLVIEGDVLDGLAAGHRLVPIGDGGYGWLRPDPDAGSDPSEPT